MVRFTRIGGIGEEWMLDMLAAPPVPCTNCGRLTRATRKCPWCNKYWDSDELRKREVSKRQIFANYDLKTRRGLKKLGYI